jgi:addiction module HigA family antidote
MISGCLQAIDLRLSKEVELVSIQYVSTNNGAFALIGTKEKSKMSKSVTTIKPIHPGEVLHQDFMEPMGISANRLAKHIKVPPNRVTSIINARRGVTGDTALRFSRAFGTTPDFWINLQSHYDLECAKDYSEIDFDSIVERAI